MSTVAVCVASYNNGHLLPELLDDLIAQTFHEFTVYVVYDGSTDNTGAVLEHYEGKLPLVVVNYQPTARVGLNKNRVVARALQDQPTYIQMIDGDDRVLPRFLEAGVERLGQDSNLDWVICWGRLFGGREGHIRSTVATVDDLLQNNNKQHSWGMFRSAVLERFNFDPSLPNGADWGVWLRVADAGYKGAIVEEELYLKRWHDSSITVTTPSSWDAGHEALRSLVLTTSGFEPPLRRLRFHMLGLVHLPISERYMACAFTQKIVKLSKMLLSLGHRVYLYGAEGSDAPCTEFIQTHSLSDIRKEWGDGDNRFEIGYNWRRSEFRHDFNTEKTEATKKFYAACIREVKRRRRLDDFLLVMQGVYHRPIADALGMWLTCEPGIGYRGSFARYRAFESAYLQNFTYGSENPGKSINGAWYDRVIPNYFDAKDFPYCAEKEDYFFFIGRMIQRKGINIAVKTCQAIGARLVLAGQGDFPINYDKAEFIGYVGPEERAKWMGRARAVFVPTIYLEAFGGVNVEAQLCGTPVLTTDFGVFPETVVQGVTGYRCNMLNDFVQAARKVHELDPATIRLHAERYLMDNVKWQFEQWFRDLYQLYRSAHEPGTQGWNYVE